ncbi:MAG TPA: hypothetical protein VFX33_16155 [Actinomycetales bacterium]|nr:hypothetical protein [Actinomycetales bacterium]
MAQDPGQMPGPQLPPGYQVPPGQQTPSAGSIAREVGRDVGRGLVEDFFYLLVGVLWWALCLGLAGGIGYLVAGKAGLLFGLLAGIVLALVGWAVAIVLGARGLFTRWRSTRR